jgi:hypothetical protein
LLADYRDNQGHALKHSLAYQRAEAMVARSGLTHDRLCSALMKHGDNVEHLVLELSAQTG